MDGLFAPVLRSGVGVAVLTRGTLVLEFWLGLAIVLPRRRWQPLLVAGLVFHAGIRALMGLWSFALAMAAALIPYLRPWERPFAVPSTTSAAGRPPRAWLG